MANRDKEHVDIEIDFSKNSMLGNDETKKKQADIIKKGNNQKNGKNKKGKKPNKLVQKFKKLKKWQRALIIIVIVILLLVCIGAGVFFGVLNGFKGDKIDDNDIGISDEISSSYADSEIVNIAFFGLDTRDENSFKGRSDTIMIISIDKAENSVKISSILRDSYVAIEGHKNQKITHAYAFGGASLALKTLNKNFNMNITDYVTVNFAKVADAIDILGGLDLEITERERVEVNNIGDDENSSFNYVEKAGMVHLTGEQAVVYARIRHIDSDNARVERQKRVLEAALEKVKNISPSKYSEMVKMAMALCETSLSASEILSFAPMLTKPLSIATTVVPGDEDNAIGGIYNGAWVWRYDLVAASNRLHKFIYNDKAVTITGKSAVDDDEPTAKKDNNSSSDKKTTTTTTKKHEQQDSTTDATTTTAPAAEKTTDDNSSETTSTTQSQITEPITKDNENNGNNENQAA